MYLAPVSGPLHSLSESERGPERGLSGPSVSLAARPSTRGPPPRLRGLRHKKDVVASGTSAERLSPLGREPGRKSLKNHRATGNDDGDGDDAGRACLSVRVSTSRRPSSALTGPRPAPRAKARRVWDRSRAL